MKKLILIATVIVSVLSQSAFAHPHHKGFKLPKGSTYLTEIGRGDVSMEVRTKSPRCPINAMCEAFSEAVLTFQLDACGDKLGPVVVEQKRASNGGIELHVTAFNIQVGDRSGMMCLAIPMEQKVIPLGLGFYNKHSVKLVMNRQVL
jgi:hypothetical protein